MPVSKIPTTRSTSQKQRKGHKKQVVTASQKSVAEQKTKRGEPPSSAQPTIEISIPPEVPLPSTGPLLASSLWLKFLLPRLLNCQPQRVPSSRT